MDPELVIGEIPSDASMKGMFLDAVAQRARADGVALASARERYLPFQWYPLREHAQLMVEAARGVWPDQTLRQGLRRLGRGGTQVLVGSTVGKVTVGAVDGVHEVLRQMGRSFSLVVRPGSIELEDHGPGYAVMALREVGWFADSHHVGVYEGLLRYAGVPQPRVRVRARSGGDTD
ncbi:MAG: DUF2378 family protein, partial [Actinobacteria bacterium]|nr:DUF2378 family protein [Actinomycetota bacterium]